MELRQLKYFLSAARCLSFTRAAEECHIVQSAMSQQIRALEKELGVDLFERTRQGLRLTPEGEATVRESEALMERIQNLSAAVRAARNGAPAPLRLGVQGNLLRETLPKALRALRSAHPEIAIQVKSDSLLRLMTDMKEDRLDCVLAMAEASS